MDIVVLWALAFASALGFLIKGVRGALTGLALTVVFGTLATVAIIFKDYFDVSDLVSSTFASHNLGDHLAELVGISIAIGYLCLFTLMFVAYIYAANKPFWRRVARQTALLFVSARSVNDR